ncbi:MAG TPA: ABC transporter permease [Puia sp.]|nr:ABC transporter permease [Puia sp.]
MLKNYLRTAWRNLTKNKIHSFINISGLSVGMAVALLIGLWIWDELSFEKYNKNYDRIALVIQNQTNNGQANTYFGMPFPMGDELRKSYGSDFKKVVLSMHWRDHILTYGEKKFTKSMSYFEPQAPELLDLTMVRGTKDALDDPNAVILSESVAKTYFGDADPLNKIMRMDDKRNVKVTGIYKDLPGNSAFSDLAFMATWQILYDDWGLKDNSHPWRMNAFQIYVQLADNVDMNKVSAKIRDAKLRKVPTDPSHPQLFLHPMSRWHLYSDFKNGVNAGGRIQYVWLFGIIGVFVLLLACINFMNLSTARSEKRAKEVGVRKAIGSLRGQLIGQFFSESLVVVSFAFMLSLVLVQLLLPFFNEVAGKKTTILWSSPVFWLISVGFILITGLIAGSYPALYLSSFRPVKVLKGVFRVGPLAAIPRKVLIVLQFTVSVVLIIGTIVVFRQIQYAKDRPIGYDRNGLVMLPMTTEEIHNHFDAVKAELMKTGTIREMAEAESFVTGYGAGSGSFEWKGKDPALSLDFPTTAVGFDYGRTVGWQFTAGRDFSRDFPTDTAAFVVNEAAVKFMGLKNPVGETVRWFGRPLTIVGVIKDMIVESPYAPVRPFFFYMAEYSRNCVIVKINPNASTSEALSKIKTVFSKYNPAQPFEYRFADEDYAKKFSDEEQIGKLAGFFTALAIFISCLGLFGMASFMAEQRTKEIGVRKVLGASVFTLWRLLSKDFIALILISLLIAIPVAYYFMSNWLEHYQYRPQLSWWIFAASGIGAIVITILTVSYQSVKAALMNPTKSLRSE